jgi:GrpB-like predicted nucleotidyltransferase (UPF0157 family)
MGEKYIFKKYISDYKTLFSDEKRFLKTFLKKIKIEHIGSTAIPKMGGKGIVDVIIGVKEKFTNEKELLIEHAYEYKKSGGTDKRLFFKKTTGLQTYHIHLVVYDELDWLQTTAFRDYLIENPTQIEVYEKVKKDAVRLAKNDGKLYRKYKKEYIDNITKQALRQSAKLY